MEEYTKIYPRIPVEKQMKFTDKKHNSFFIITTPSKKRKENALQLLQLSFYPIVVKLNRCCLCRIGGREFFPHRSFDEFKDMRH